ncbi:MAG: DUF2723 domain-containing protein [Prevotellaceae bacterium]|jgi:hypothetical protein|nr:DUF2723 domain-containing protein [Prevotellaceae bacterium]
MKQFKCINNLTGWAVFAVAAVTYLLTIEPTTSFWDCGEFIASSYKLEVGHAPGNPVFQLLGRFFSMFVPTSSVAMMINAMSALCSAFTILFLFWSITHLARRIVERRQETLTTGNIIAVMGAGAVGALVYTFSDTFWFSAVEAEVYAMSSLFTAVVFWAILRWEEEADEKYANRWLVLIAYLMGLSIGVHLLNLLAIPAIALIYYFKKYTVSVRGVILTLLVSVALLGFTMLLIPLLPRVAGWFDLLFVNVFKLPFNTGTVFFMAGLCALLAWGLYASYRKGKVFWNTALLCLTVFIIGVSSFAMIVIRSSAGTPTNENQPDNAFSLLYYLNREQYGTSPLLKGQTFVTPAVGYKDNPIYAKKDGRYVTIEGMSQPEWDKRYTMLFPRMWSSKASHVDLYEEYMTGGGRGKMVAGTEKRMPTQSENLRYFFDYQLGYMYWRYFMWNFAGRQNDIQGHGESYYGNWECGIPFIDKARLGNVDEMPPFLANHKARNHYYMLPLLLGLLGFFSQLSRDKRNFLVVGALFVLTGAAIVVYLNQDPMQPRERDYAYAGSFYAFALWVGLGVMPVYRFLRKGMPAIAAAALASAACIIVPVQMGAVNWDDHDRSNRYIARDFAYNYFMSCEKDAIIFTVGDNDTFPLWYIQEVEGVRTDVRVVNTSLLNSDWYIDQMKRRQYDSPPVPFKLPRDNYLGVNDYIFIYDRLNEPYDLKEVMGFVADPRAKIRTNQGERESYFPTRRFTIPVNKENVLKNGTVKPENAHRIPDTITITLSEKKNGLLKAEMMILDLLANNDWERPIYFVGMGGDTDLGLRDYLQYEGFAHRLTPFRTAASQSMLDRDTMYHRLMDVYRWGNMNDPDVWIDNNIFFTLSGIISIRNMYSNIAYSFAATGDTAKNVALLDRVMEIMPRHTIPYITSQWESNDRSIVLIAQLYAMAGQTDKANAIASDILDELEQNLHFFSNAKTQGDALGINLRTLRLLSLSLSPVLNEDLQTRARELRQYYRQYNGLAGKEYDNYF